MARKRTRSKAPTPITGVAAGNLGTAANLDDTQVLRTEDLGADVPDWLEQYRPAPPALQAAVVEPVVEPVVAPVPAHEAAPSRPTAARTSPRPISSPRAGRQGLALVGAGAFAALVLLAGAGILSQLDLGSGANGGQPNAPAFEFTSQPPLAETPAPAETGGGHGHDKCHGRHCN